MESVTDLEMSMTPSQAARRLGVSAQAISNYIKSGKLPAMKTPLGRLISPVDVEHLAAERGA